MKKEISCGLSLTALLLSLCTSCSRPGKPQESVSTLDQNVTNGTIATNDPAVVGLVANGRIGCTGVLVAPRVALTAAHCLTGPPVDSVLVGLSADEGSSVDVLRAWIHPSSRVGSSDYDLGVLLLRDPIDVAAVPMNEQPLTAADVGRDIRVVGFGTVSAGDVSEPLKRQGVAVIGSLSPLTLSIEPSPSQPCAGDSGGPALWSMNGEQVVVGIVSRGDADCTRYAQVVRVDAHLEAFVRPLLARIAATSSAIGDSCILPSNCASDLCLSPSDAPSFPYCSRECGDATDCAPTMECAELPLDGSMKRVCQFVGPSPGAIGAPCAEPTECEFRMCERFASAPAKTCGALCFPEDADPCPHGGECSPVASAGDAFGCSLDPAEDAPAEPSIGCGIASPSGGSDLSRAVLLMGGVLALGRRRRSLPSAGSTRSTRRCTFRSSGTGCASRCGRLWRRWSWKGRSKARRLSPRFSSERRAQENL